jgi:hypothetical protein
LKKGLQKVRVTQHIADSWPHILTPSIHPKNRATYLHTSNLQESQRRLYLREYGSSEFGFLRMVADECRNNVIPEMIAGRCVKSPRIQASSIVN